VQRPPLSLLPPRLRQLAASPSCCSPQTSRLTSPRGSWRPGMLALQQRRPPPLTQPQSPPPATMQPLRGLAALPRRVGPARGGGAVAAPAARLRRRQLRQPPPPHLLLRLRRRPVAAAPSPLQPQPARRRRVGAAQGLPLLLPVRRPQPGTPHCPSVCTASRAATSCAATLPPPPPTATIATRGARLWRRPWLRWRLCRLSLAPAQAAVVARAVISACPCRRSWRGKWCVHRGEIAAAASMALAAE
jgi:hypothetical protein